MQKEKLMNQINSKNKGVYRKISWTSDMTVLAGYKKEGIQITKQTKAVCRLGIVYSHISSVIQMNAITGEVVDPKALPWGEWENDYLIAHKGNSYLRVTKSRSPHHHTEVHYYKNGVEISADEAKIYTTASAWSQNNSPVFTLKIDNILSLD